MSYTSQMPSMRQRATDDGIVVNDMMKYYRVSLLRAQVRLDLDLAGQQYVAEHQTWASFWPGEAFPGVDPRNQAQIDVDARVAATSVAAAASESLTTTSSTILKEISTQAKPDVPSTGSQPNTPMKATSSTETKGRGNDNNQDSDAPAGSKHKHENGRESRSRKTDVQENRDPDDDASTQISTSPSSPAKAPNLNTDTVICGNCSTVGHSLGDCTINIDSHGYLNGCPRCNTLLHNYAECPAPKFTHDDYFYLVTRRHGKPPVRCSWDFRRGYWKKFSERIEQDHPSAMRPQTAAFAQERRNKGVVQKWDEIVLDPIWYGRDDWTTNIGKMIHPLDKEVFNPNRSAVDLKDKVGEFAGGDLASLRNGGKRAADGEGKGKEKGDEPGRLRREVSSEGSVRADSVKSGSGTGQTDGNGLNGRQPKPTLEPWSRKGRKQERHDGGSWKKRRLQDQQRAHLGQGNFNSPTGSGGQAYAADGYNGGVQQDFQVQYPGGPLSQGQESQGFGQGVFQHFVHPQRQDSVVQPQDGSGFSREYFHNSAPAPDHQGNHLQQGFQNSQPQQQDPHFQQPYHPEQQRSIPYDSADNPFPLADPPPASPNNPHPTQKIGTGQASANAARFKLGPVPGWTPQYTDTWENRNGKARAKLGPLPGWVPPVQSQNQKRRQKQGNDSRDGKHFIGRGEGSGTFEVLPFGAARDGGYQGQGQGQSQCQPTAGSFKRQPPRNSTSSMNIPRKGMGFEFRPGSVPPTQPLSRVGMQSDGLRNQVVQQFGGFVVQQGIPAPQHEARGPTGARVDGMIESRSGQGGDMQFGGNGGIGMQNGYLRYGHGNQRFQLGTPPAAGPKPGLGYHSPQPQMQMQQPTQHLRIRGSAQGPPPGQQAAWATGGYCINCRSHGHVIEECEGNCGLCRAGGHKARECRFFDLGER